MGCIFPSSLVAGEQRKNPFGRAFCDENPLGLPLHHDREPPPLEVKRNLVALGVFACRLGWRLMEDDLIEWTANARLELAVEVREFQRALRGISKGIETSGRATWFRR